MTAEIRLVNACISNLKELIDSLDKQATASHNLGALVEGSGSAKTKPCAFPRTG